MGMAQRMRVVGGILRQRNSLNKAVDLGIKDGQGEKKENGANGPKKSTKTNGLETEVS